MPTDLPFERVLLTGADGFVGRRLARALAARLPISARIALATRDRPQQPAQVRMDLTDDASVDLAVQQTRPDLIIHLAAQSSVGQASADGASSWATNLGGSLALAGAIARHVERPTVLFSSSAEVYGAAFNDGPVDDGTRPEPKSAYAKSKLACEFMFQDVLPATARLLIMRPSNHSGPGQDTRFVLPSFAAQMRNDSIDVGNLSAARDFLHVDDVIDAYLHVLGEAPSDRHSMFNVSSGQTVSIGELLERMISLSGSQASVRVDPARLRPLEVPIASVDSSRLRASGWEPVRSRDEMLQDLLNANRIGA